jgi:sugar O-acyltransferase (sialic acid O-acetyltransferase NeuD family)
VVDGRGVVIFGTGDFARTARTYLDADSDYDVVAFTVDARYRESDELLGLPVVDFEEVDGLYPPDRFGMFVAIGFSGVNKNRRGVYEAAKRRGYRLITYVSSAAHCVGGVDIGDNCFVFEANVIQPNVTIGSDVIIWSGNHIGHDSSIGDHCFIASHAVISGNVHIGEGCFVGVNATFRDGITVAPECVIGAGALIMKDTERGAVYSVRGTQPLERKSWDLTL